MYNKNVKKKLLKYCVVYLFNGPVLSREQIRLLRCTTVYLFSHTNFSVCFLYIIYYKIQFCMRVRCIFVQ